MIYWQEGPTSTAILPTSIPDVVGQHNKMGAALIFIVVLADAAVVALSHQQQL